MGGGASGLMAAGVAAARGHQVTLLERNREVGKKIRISGKGRCNITNDTDVPGLEKHIPGNPKFLRSAFYAFGPKETMAFFETLGVPVKVERGGRAFPASDNADDIVQALIAYCSQHGVRMVSNATAQHIAVREGVVTGVSINDGPFYPADAVILATGGSSYPGTGSRGDGYRMAAEVGHTIIPIRPALVPLVTRETWPAEAQGLSLRNVSLAAITPDGKKRFSDQGEMLFTHFGVSGPLVLAASRHVADQPGSTLVIDLKPALSEEQLDARVLRDFEQYSRRIYANALIDLLPSSLIPIFIRLSRISTDTPVHQISREQRHTIVEMLKGLKLTVKGPRPMAEAIVTAGGVSVKEINPQTMESKIVHGLYFTGETIDVDGYTGGFNLQIAWSTGHLAGASVCRGEEVSG